MGMEVITTTDKDQRDRMFDDLRKNGNRLERQVVKFSSNGTWSLAYPAKPDSNPTPRRARRDKDEYERTHDMAGHLISTGRAK